MTQVTTKVLHFTQVKVFVIVYSVDNLEGTVAVDKDILKGGPPTRALQSNVRDPLSGSDHGLHPSWYRPVTTVQV